MTTSASLVLRAVALVGADDDLGPIVAAREAWPGCDARIADRRVQLVATDVRAAWPDAPERIARMDRLTRLSLLAVHRLAVAASITNGFEATRDEPVGISFASALATLGTNESFDRRYHAREARSGRALGDAHLFPYTAPNAAAGEIGIAFGLHGPAVVRVAGGRADLDALRVASIEPDVRRWVAVAADVLSPAALLWLSSAGVLHADEIASEGALAFLLDVDDDDVQAPRIDTTRTGVDAPDLERATRHDGAGRVRFGIATGCRLAAAYANGDDARGRWISRCASGAWSSVDVVLGASRRAALRRRGPAFTRRRGPS